MSLQLWALPIVCPSCARRVTTLHNITLCSIRTGVQTESVRND